MTADRGADDASSAAAGSTDAEERSDGQRSGTLISVCVVCHNEADRLGHCLASVAWADEVIVMDLSSTDDSAAVATRYGARVLHRSRVFIVEVVRNEVASVARGEWILVLDPDERITEGLARELRRVAERPDVDAVIIPRMNYDLGYPPTNAIHRYEPQLRMYRRATVAWPTTPNALPSVPAERVCRLPGRDDLVMVHDRSRNVPEILDRYVRYVPAQAQSMLDRGQVFTARAMVGALGHHLHRQFIRGQGLRDGVPGLIRGSILVAFHFFVWACFWQLSGAKRSPADDRLLQRLGMVIESLGKLVDLLRAPLKAARRAIALLRRSRSQPR